MEWDGMAWMGGKKQIVGFVNIYAKAGCGTERLQKTGAVSLQAFTSCTNERRRSHTRPFLGGSKNNLSTLIAPHCTCRVYHNILNLSCVFVPLQAAHCVCVIIIKLSPFLYSLKLNVKVSKTKETSGSSGQDLFIRPSVHVTRH